MSVSILHPRRRHHFYHNHQCKTTRVLSGTKNNPHTSGSGGTKKKCNKTENRILVEEVEKVLLHHVLHHEEHKQQHIPSY
jgi:hypothetical protein